MKNLIKLLLSTFLLSAILFSCEKQENKVYLEGGTAPVLTTTAAATMVLDTTKAATTAALVFKWTNPDYKFNTGPSSQDVTYILQIDTTGSNFTNPNRQEVAIASSLSFSPTVKEFNAFFNKMELKYDQPHNIEFRIKATLANGLAAPLYSNVIKIVVTPYLDVAIPIPTTGELFITGDAVPSSWTNNPPMTQKATKVSITEYTITAAFVSGKYYKFLVRGGGDPQANWQPQYGVKLGSAASNADGGELGLNNTVAPYDKDPDGIPTPAVAGNYKITLNFITGKYKVEKI
jgi:starch-binding outer membrane protein SusE/F